MGNGKHRIKNVIKREMGSFVHLDFEEGKNYLKSKEGRYVLGLLPQEFPKTLHYGFLKEFVSSEDKIDIGIYLNRINDDYALSLIQHELNVIMAELMSSSPTSYKYSKLLLEKESAQSLRNLISARKTHLYRITFAFLVRGNNYGKAKELQERTASKLRALNFKFSYAYYRIWEVFRLILPIFKNRIPYYEGRIAHTDVATALFPFISSTFSVMSDYAILYGVNAINNTPVFVDRFLLSSYNMLIFGKTGSGKSYFEKLSMIRSKVADPDTLIYAIDPLGENGGLFEKMGGINIRVWDPEQKTVINPLDPQLGDNVHERVKMFIANISTLFEMQPEEKALLDVTLFKLLSRENKVTISSLLKEMERNRNLERLRIFMRVFTEGTLSFLDQESNVDLKNSKWINFDLSDVPEDYLPFFMFLITGFIYSQIKKRGNMKKLFYIDEVHHIWKFKECAELLEWMARHTRHYRAGMTLLTQSANDGFTNEHTRAIMENTHIHLLLHHDYLDERARAFYKLLPHEEEVVYSAHGGKGYGFSTGLLRVGSVKIPLKIIASKEEDRLLQT